MLRIIFYHFLFFCVVNTCCFIYNLYVYNIICLVLSLFLFLFFTNFGRVLAELVIELLLPYNIIMYNFNYYYYYKIFELYEIVSSLKENFCQLIWLIRWNNLHVMININQHRIVKLIIIKKNFIIIYYIFVRVYFKYTYCKLFL